MQGARPPRFARQARRLTLAICLAILPAVAFATPPRLPGHQDTAFVQGLAAWLNNDEGAALPIFATLAQDGNVAAQVLLGLIDKTPALQGPFLAQLPRADRLDLIRASGGLSGQSWLIRARDQALVAAWLELWTVGATPQVLEAFRSLSEPRAAREALITLAARDAPGLAALDLASVDPELLYTLWRNASPERRTTVSSLIPPEDPQRALMGERIDARVLDRWLASSPAAAPLAALCAAVCPESGDTCRGAAYRALNSHDALLTLGTPSEALVDQDTFLRSPRGHSTVLQRILLSTDMRGRRAMLAYLHNHSTCLAEALTAEHQQYYPRPTSSH